MEDSGARTFGAEAEAPHGARRVVFEHTVDGLFRVALGKRLSSAAHAALREAGLDLSRKLLPAYPLETWRAGVEVAVRDLYPEHSRAEGYRRIGHDVVDGLAQTTMGRAAVGVGRLLGPLRALRRMNHTFRSADNYVESRLTEHGPTRCDLWINEVLGQPTYYQGILEACLALAGAHGGQVEVLSQEGAGATYRLEWQP
jgi:uncharacterized protein (TIGR02265 family)